MMFSPSNYMGRAAAAVVLLTMIPLGPSADLRIRIALSDTLFRDLNENDARAAVKAWSESLVQSTHLQVEGVPQLMNSEEIDRAIAGHQIDGFSITTPEYVKIASYIDPIIFTDEYSVKHGIEYLLLIRRDSGITDLAGLHGRMLIVCQGPAMSLVFPWLETALGTSKLESSDRFFGRIKIGANPSKTVLPLFFGTADAAIVTGRAYDLMCELNPQLRQKLQALVSSPKLLTAFFGVHKDTSDEIKARIKQALIHYYETPSGRQTLTLFQSQNLVAVDASMLRPSVDLLASYERLKARRQGVPR